MALLYTGTFGGLSSILANASANGPTDPSTISEWNAVATFSRVTFTPLAPIAAATSSMADSAPDSTTWSGALWLATTTGEPVSVNTACTSASGAATASIAPLVVFEAAAISSPRILETFRSSVSSSTPAACSALISP